MASTGKPAPAGSPQKAPGAREVLSPEWQNRAKHLHSSVVMTASQTQNWEFKVSLCDGILSDLYYFSILLARLDLG